MKSQLTIIIPCYNCAETLGEAVESCYTQSLSSFEIVMVDDGSTDKTRETMERLARKYKEIKIFFHKGNKGGGAARNTAIKNSDADVIFCLDSDDILPPATLVKMLDTLKKENCDGVVFQETRFFESNRNKTDVVANEIKPGQSIKLLDMFQKKGFLTMVNFMYRKEAYAGSGVYPENHGFDTQDFGYRFIAKGYKVLVCPDTYYLHRRFQKSNSYFERAYEEGRISINMYLIYEKIIEYLPDSAVDLMMRFDVFHKNRLEGDNLKTQLETLMMDMTVTGMDKKDAQHGPKLISDFRFAVQLHRDKDFSKAIDIYKIILETGFTSSIIFFNLIRSSLAISGVREENIEDEFKKTICSLTLENRKPSMIKKIARRTGMSALKAKVKKIWTK